MPFITTFNYPSDDFYVNDFLCFATVADLVKCFHPCKDGAREKIAFLAVAKVKTRQEVTCVCVRLDSCFFFGASATHDRQSCVATEAV